MKRYIALLIVPELFFMLPAAADAKGDRLSAPAASTVNCHVATKAQVARLFDRWNNSLHTGDPARVAANYTHDAVLLPTLSGRAGLGNDSRHACYKLYAYVRPENLAEGWSRDRIVSEIVARGVPCYQGSCSEVYLERAFDGTPWRPARPLAAARELGETSVMFLVHPTLTEAEISKTCEIVRDVLSRAGR